MTDTLDVAWLLDLPSQQRARVLQRLTPEERKAVEREVESKTPWRENPATFAHHLTNGDYKLWAYIRLLGQRFREAAMGEDPNQMWWLASQYGKTRLLLWGALWLLDRDPRIRIMYVSYDADKAVEECGKARDLAIEHADKLRFRLRPDQRARGKWTTPEGGGLYGVGIAGSIVGWPQDVLLLDDLIKGWQAAHSAAQRDFVWNVYRSQIRLRVQKFDALKISVGTRWHEDDFQARLRASSDVDEYADKWSVLRLPAIAEAPSTITTDPLLRQADPLGRRPGDVLEPERFPPREVYARRSGLGPYLFSAMEQQRPSPPEGGIFKRDWWKLEDFLPPAFDLCASSWDMKLKEKESGDYTVGQVWGTTGKDCWLIDQLRGQWSQALTATAMCLVSVRYPECRRHLVESAGYGPEVMESLRTPAPGYRVPDDVASQLGMTDEEREPVERVRQRGLPGIIPVPVKGSKYVRALAVSGYVAGGDVHLPAQAPWVPQFLEEVSSFNTGTHDDVVDAMTQALSRLHRVRRGRGSGEVQRQIRAGSVG